jgi:hypothetical protein
MKTLFLQHHSITRKKKERASCLEHLFQKLLLKNRMSKETLHDK